MGLGRMSSGLEIRHLRGPWCGWGKWSGAVVEVLGLPHDGVWREKRAWQGLLFLPPQESGSSSFSMDTPCAIKTILPNLP